MWLPRTGHKRLLPRSLGSLVLGEVRCHVVGTFRQPYGEAHTMRWGTTASCQQKCEWAWKHPRATIKPSGLQPRLAGLKPGARTTQDTPEFRTHRNWDTTCSLLKHWVCGDLLHGNRHLTCSSFSSSVRHPQTAFDLLYLKKANNRQKTLPPFSHPPEQGVSKFLL